MSSSKLATFKQFLEIKTIDSQKINLNNKANFKVLAENGLKCHLIVLFKIINKVKIRTKDNQVIVDIKTGKKQFIKFIF